MTYPYGFRLKKRYTLTDDSHKRHQRSVSLCLMMKREQVQRMYLLLSGHDTDDRLDVNTMLLMAVSTSIDALAIGIVYS